MTESVIADFMTDIVPDAATHTEPSRGRVVMSEKRIVFATDDERTTVPITGIFDIQHGRAPKGLEEFFEDTVTIGYENGSGKHVAVVEGADQTVERFTTLLFKAVLNGTSVLAKHPARIGGRITDEKPRKSSLYLTDGAVEFRGDHSFAVNVSTVTHFERMTRDYGAGERPVLSVRHVASTQQVTSEIALDSERKMNVLGRFLRIEYRTLKEDFQEIDVVDDEIEALVSLYTAGPDANLAAVMGIDASRAQLLSNKLDEKNLVETRDDGMHLTSLGRLAVSHRIEDVNT